MEDSGLTRFLPDDVIADILHRLAPRSLAVSRCVCKAWRAIIDDDERCVLRADLLPVSLGGIFIDLSHAQAPPEFFARSSSMATKIAGKLKDYVDVDHFLLDPISIVHCCNGLLLLDQRVVNPATRQWERLPPCPALPEGTMYFGDDDAYLAFDPAMSPHYEVLLVPTPRHHDTSSKEMEWPPTPYMMVVYSSITGRWEERPFVRQGAPAGTIAQVRSASEPESRHAAYWHGALYVHCQIDFVMRIRLSDDTYEVIKLPDGINASAYPQLHLGKSKNGVYIASVGHPCQLQIRFLNESGGKMEWVLKHDISVQALIAHFSKHSEDGPTNSAWILQECNHAQEDIKGITVVKNDSDWDSDDENAVDVEDRDAKGGFYGYNHIFGFHPFREVVFLNLSCGRVIAYHFDSSKIQDLGKLCIPYRDDLMNTAFIYTPCWIGGLSGQCNLESCTED